MKSKIAVWVGIAFLFVSNTAFAGVMDVVKSVMKTEQIWIGIGTVVLLYVLKRIPNDKIYSFVFNLFKKVGVICTVGLNRYKWSAPFWETHIEAWFVDFLQNTVGAALNGYIEGLRTNNKQQAK